MKRLLDPAPSARVIPADSVRTISARLLLAMALIAGSAGAAPPQDIRAPVIALYKMFAWEALSSDETFGNGVTGQSAAQLAEFFDPSLTSLLVRDRACQTKRREMCKLDFDILFDAQDPRVTDLTIVAVKYGEVVVMFKDPVTEIATHIRYVVRRGSRGWRITDVVYEGEKRHSLRTMLSQPMVE